MASPKTWRLWLMFFLLLEIPAAIDGKEGGTLSEAVWSTFKSTLDRAFLLAFLATLTVHLVVGVPSGAWIALTGAPVGLIILRRWDRKI